jgi:hypothetical protein
MVPRQRWHSGKKQASLLAFNSFARHSSACIFGRERRTGTKEREWKPEWKEPLNEWLDFRFGILSRDGG